jgi:hypothetical protein
MTLHPVTCELCTSILANAIRDRAPGVVRVTLSSSARHYMVGTPRHAVCASDEALYAAVTS